MSAGGAVIVVDDDEALRESVCEVLEDVGYTAIGMPSGAAALQRLREGPGKPELILLDLMMPGMSGWQFREEQLKDPTLSSIPVVVMTANRDVRGIQADEIVYKPITLDELLSVIRRRSRSSVRNGNANGSSSANGRPAAASPGSGASPATAARAGAIPAAAHAEPRSLFAGGGEMGRRMSEIDWSRTPLGPVESWPQSLRTCVRIILTSRQPMFVWWGDELVNLYNDAYKSIVGGKHPGALGQPARVVWREIWDQVGPRAESAMRAQEGTYDEALLLIMERYGYEEETYYTFSYSPVPNDRGGTGGIICANTADTERIIGERQLALLRELAARTADARSLEQSCRVERRRAGAPTPRDLPFALLYVLQADGREFRLMPGRWGSRRAAPAAPQGDRRRGRLGPLGRSPSALQALEMLRAAGGPRGPASASCPSGRLVTARPARPPWSPPSPPGRRATGRRPGGRPEPVPPLRPGLPPLPGPGGQPDLRQPHLRPGLRAGARARAEALAAIDRTKTAFFSNVSHEFRTPLTLMLGPVEDLLRGHPRAELGAAHRQQLEILHRNGLRLQKLVNALLDFSRLEAGRHPGRLRAHVDLADAHPGPGQLLPRRGGAGRPRATRSTARTLVRAGLRRPGECGRRSSSTSSPTRSSSPWRARIRRLAGRDEGPRASRSPWRDTGVGVPEEAVPRLFERFHRVEGTRARTHEGSGIGLAHGAGAGQAARRLRPRREPPGPVGRTFTLTIPKGVRTTSPWDRLGATRMEEASVAIGPAVVRGGGDAAGCRTPASGAPSWPLPAVAVALRGADPARGRQRRHARLRSPAAGAALDGGGRGGRGEGAGGGAGATRRTWCSPT